MKDSFVINVTFEEDTALDMEFTESQSAGGGGKNGKSAYEYACDGGYTGTEAEFAAKLAAETPTSLPNPHSLTLTGAVDATYDGTVPVSLEIPEGSAVSLDTTLTAAGQAAEAKAVGDALAEKLSESELDDAVTSALAAAKESGEFDGADGINGMSNVAKMYLINILKSAQYTTDQTGNIAALEEALGGSARIQFFSFAQGRISTSSSSNYISSSETRVSHIGTNVILIPGIRYRLVGVEGVRYGVQQLRTDGLLKVQENMDLISDDKTDSGWQTTGYEFVADDAAAVCWLTASYESGNITPTEAMPVYIEALP